MKSYVNTDFISDCERSDIKTKACCQEIALCCRHTFLWNKMWVILKQM